MGLRTSFWTTVPATAATLLALAAVDAHPRRLHGPPGPARRLTRGLGCPGFEVNRGQATPAVRFLAWGPGFQAAFRPALATLALAGDGGRRASIGLRFEGARGDARLVGLDELAVRSHYYAGTDPSRWQRDVAHFARVRYEGLYPGVDVVFHLDDCNLVYDFEVAPGADPDQITVGFDGTRGLRLDGQGDLVLETDDGELRQRRPVLYQGVGGERRLVEGSYTVRGASRVGVTVAAYDPSAPLVIDPTLVFSTYWGGVRADGGKAVATDAAGNVYVAGLKTNGDDVSTDALVAKYDPAGALLWATQLGGFFREEARGIAVDAAGNVHLTGSTGSFPSSPPGRPEFPRTANAFQFDYGGGAADAFVSVLAPDGTLVYSTFFGGNGDDEGQDLVLDAAGDAIVTGSTSSTNFPLAQLLQAALAGGSDAFVAKFNPAKTALVYSTYLGGGSSETGARLAVDAAGAAYVAGTTASADFPTVDALQATYGGGACDAFVAKIDPSGAFLEYSTFLGGSGADEGHAVAVDGASAAYVTGTTTSADFPTVDPMEGSLSAPPLADAFLAKLAPWGFGLDYSTYLGSKGGSGVAVDAARRAAITGGDLLAAKVDASGAGLVYVQWGIGGSAVAIGPSGDAVVTGMTLSNLVPTLNPAQARNGGMLSGRGREDAFTTRVSEVSPSPQFEENDAAVAYTGTWMENTLPVHSGGRAVLSMDPGATATFTFSGTGIQVFGYRDEWSGAASVTTDAFTQWGSLDTYASPAAPRAVVLSLDGLAAGTHTLTLQVANARNQRSRGNWVWIDGFTVLHDPVPAPTPPPSPTPPPPPPPGGARVEEGDPRVLYSGAWYPNGYSGHSGGSAVLSMTAGSRATLGFRGTGVRWITYRDEWSGIARVLVDGAAVADLDTYASPGEAQAVAYRVDGLHGGAHTLTISVTGGRRPASGGSWVWVDAFEVQP